MPPGLTSQSGWLCRYATERTGLGPTHSETPSVGLAVQVKVLACSRAILSSALPASPFHELVQVNSEEVLPIDALVHGPSLERLLLTNSQLATDSNNDGLALAHFFFCRLKARVKADNCSGTIRRLTTEEIPSHNQASFRSRLLRLPEATLLEQWLGQYAIATDQSKLYTFGDA